MKNREELAYDFSQQFIDVEDENTNYEAQAALIGFIAGHDSAQKEIKQKLLDKLNHLRSDYQQQTQSKLGRVSNFKYETELLAKIELLKELMK